MAMASTSSSSLPIPLSTPSHDPSNKTQKTSLFRISPPPSPSLKTPSIRSRLSKLCQEGQPHTARQLFDTFPRPTTVICNTIIIGFICNRLPLEAILFYSKLKSSSLGTKFDSYTYSSTLKACAETRSLKIGKAIHCHLIRCLSNPSRIVYNSLLNMYSSCLSYLDCSKYDLVHKVFDTMRKRDVVAWNTMVSWYVKTERYVEAIRLFRVVMKMGIKPSPVSFVNVFPAFSSVGDFKNADVLYGMLVKMGSEYVNDLFVVSSVIFMFAELGHIDFARKVFDHCLEKNTEIWNTMIGGYVQNNFLIEGIDLFLKAVETEQTVLDDVTFLSVLTAVSQLQCLDLAQQLHAFVIKNLAVFPVMITNAIIVMYSRCNSVHTSFEVFEKMVERDVVSWNTMISAFVQNGMDDEGLMLVYEMQKQGFAIDSVTVTALLSAASNLRSQEIGKQTYAYLLRHGIQFEGMDGYLIDITSLVDMYSKSGSINYAESVFTKLPDKNSVTYTTMILAYGQHGMGERALSLFHSMKKSGIEPDAITFIAVLSACSHSGLVDEGLQIFESMEKDFKIQPSTPHYCCVTDMLGRVGRLVEAY
ncbi:hypothetical protein D5086_011873, partial [Populus alba]